jgi:eukaryotic-like serine/threonine-protein kinase
VEYGAAFAEALVGDAGAAQAMADDLERRFPEDTSAKFYYVPPLAALDHHTPAKAIEWLQVSSPYELGEPQSCFYGFFGVMLGRAYLMDGDQTKAKAAIVTLRNPPRKQSVQSSGATVAKLP